MRRLRKCQPPLNPGDFFLEPLDDRGLARGGHAVACAARVPQRLLVFAQFALELLKFLA
jgi:hypothetical protein